MERELMERSTIRVIIAIAMVKIMARKRILWEEAC
jgi:hypothetical protein